MLMPIVGGTLVTVMFLTPGKNKSSALAVLVISGVLALGRIADEVDAWVDFWAIVDLLDSKVEVCFASNNEVD